MVTKCSFLFQPLIIPERRLRCFGIMWNDHADGLDDRTWSLGLGSRYWRDATVALERSGTSPYPTGVISPKEAGDSGFVGHIFTRSFMRCILGDPNSPTKGRPREDSPAIIPWCDNLPLAERRAECDLIASVVLGLMC